MISKLLKTVEYDETQGWYANALPEFKNIYTGDNEFRVVIEDSSKEEYQVHFPGFLIASGCLIINSILSGIKEWLFKEGIRVRSVQVENSDSFINKAVPIRTKLNAEVSVEKLLAKVYVFTAEIIDEAGSHFGFYLITIEIK